MHHAATVGEDLDAGDFENSAIVRLGSAWLGGRDHAEAGGGRTETAAEHETIAGFEEMEDDGDAGEA